MASYNRVILVGNLTRDPELKQLASGQALCKLGLASNRQFKNKQTGTMTQEVCFVDIDVWGAQAESCNRFLEKGKQVLIEGRLKFDSWQEADGTKRSKHSIVADRVTFLGGATVEDSADNYDSQTFTPAEPIAEQP
jgi:single-strand DNA-binding protein